ncbi:hypothetical protein QBC43DRAFT_347081 [Cladorrhinum sp. PSN259]|nr:hypothetical protein QBC43DRAFT_347081 [Cladorrhinum sp. PSN259]
MPKKRHQTQYSKPPSTAPALLSSSGSAASRHNSHHDNSNNKDDNNKPRSVNELLANLRLSHGASTTTAPPQTVPAAVRRALNRGRRLPPGPPPPVSWLVQQASASTKPTSRAAIEYGGAKHYQQRPLPGGRMPVRGSLIDLVLRQFARSWDWQKEYCQYVLHQLPAHLRSALLSYLTRERHQGVTISDLKIILLPPSDPDSEDQVPVDNLDFHRLDLTNSPGQTLRLRDLSKFLFPLHHHHHNHQASSSSPTESCQNIPDSWDSPSTSTPASLDYSFSLSIPKALLPNLTHLSLAVNPLHPNPICWPHLLSLARHLPPTLTHLSLAFWPEPSFSTASPIITPFASVPIEHNNTTWSESLMVLSRLSKLLYGLEYLDLTGCGSWVSCLWSTVGDDFVDWVDAWGQVSRIVLYPGYELSDEGEGAAETADVARYVEVVENAGRVERWIRSMRGGERGRGKVRRGIVVETCDAELKEKYKKLKG